MVEIKENHLKQLNEIEIEINKTKLKILKNQYLNNENINLRL